MQWRTWQSIVVGGVVSIAWSSWAFPVQPTRREAAVVLDIGRPGLAPDSVVRCAPGQRVGIYQGRGHHLTGPLGIEGCEIAVFVEGGVLEDDERERAIAPVDAVTSGVSIATTNCLVGIWAAGSGGELSSNSIGGCRNGIVVTGSQVRVLRNTIVQPDDDGIVIVGQGNYVAGNVIDGAGANGIDVISAVPMVAPGVFLAALRTPARSNGLYNNRVINGRGFATGRGYDLRQWPVSCPASGNTWSGNVWTTRSALCLR